MLATFPSENKKEDKGIHGKETGLPLEGVISCKSDYDAPSPAPSLTLSLSRSCSVSNSFLLSQSQSRLREREWESVRGISATHIIINVECFTSKKYFRPPFAC